MAATTAPTGISRLQIALHWPVSAVWRLAPCAKPGVPPVIETSKVQGILATNIHVGLAPLILAMISLRDGTLALMRRVQG